jgi:acyl-CoA reductase-like NAD-dependent aldehyde dehydrogenase
MTETLTDLSTYPIGAATRRQLERPLFGHVIDGEVVPSIDGGTMPVIDPATGEQVASAASGSPEDVERAVRSAKEAFDDGRWRFLPPLERERRLRKLGQLVAERGDEFAELDVIDVGLLRVYTGFIVQFAVDGIEYYAGWPTKLSGEIPPTPHDFSVYVQREPVGIVGLIMPWNGPTAGFAMVAAGIAAGNCVVLKPAEQTPMTSTLMGELAIEAGIPPGVFNVVQGLGQNVGEPLVKHPDISFISFTGSVPTGARIQAAASERVKPVALELGGKSPFIVFADADLNAAATGAALTVWGASGQVCTAGTRTLVHRDVHDDVMEKILETSRDMRIGSPFDAETELGPVVSEDQLERIQQYVGIGRDEGAELALGGGRYGDVGFFHEPTIFTNVRNDMRIAQEEIFGPVMSIIPFGSEEEAYSIANNTEYGLAAGVWTSDLGRAHRASRALRVGTVWVNTYQMVYPSVPYGGVKQSGHGRTLGHAMIDELTELKSVWMNVAS